ncbi:tetratricopeptide repeat protein [Cerasicoccus frondis]|uniref:tetratricopeptide repeat protein n=1 Tax=Cerasicoccus frondis TaxID=490090 RepID=UPI0028528853|nr:hypothetical protein [Cerasicoccus frondis]
MAFIVILLKEGVSLALNIWPHDVTFGPNVSIPNDGKQILMALKGKTSPPNHNVDQNYLGELHRYDKSVSADVLKIKELPIDDQNTINYYRLHLHDGNYDEALKIYTESIATMPILPVEKAWLFDSLATYTPRHNQDHLETCESIIQHLSKVLPDAKTLKGTLGALQIELKRYRDGIQTLLPLTEPESEHIDRAISCLYVAKAYHALGDESACQAFRSIRDRVPYEDNMTKKLEQELDAALNA